MTQKIRCAIPHCRRFFIPDPRVKNHHVGDSREGAKTNRDGSL
ncbi:MAG: hypothetical protein ABSB22_06935 [Thermodesulfobacteriota bacterium]